jgi:hypothetical protein
MPVCGPVYSGDESQCHEHRPAVNMYARYPTSIIDLETQLRPQSLARPHAMRSPRAIWLTVLSTWMRRMR